MSTHEANVAQTPADIEQFLRRLREAGLNYRANDIERITWKKLPFYENGSLVCVHSHTDRYFIAAGLGAICDQQMVWLDGSSHNIYVANALASLRTDQDSVKDYVRLFCGFLHAEEGPFQIIESLRGYVLLEGESPKNMELQVIAVNSSAFLVSGCVLYGGILFRSFFEVRHTGGVAMTGDETIGPIVRLH